MPPPIGSVLATAVTVGTSAVALPTTALANRKDITVYNNGTVAIYLGDSGVTTSSGIPLMPGQWFTGDYEETALYAISGTAGQNVRVLESS